MLRIVSTNILVTIYEFFRWYSCNILRNPDTLLTGYCLILGKYGAKAWTV